MTFIRLDGVLEGGINFAMDITSQNGILKLSLPGLAPCYDSLA